MKLFGRDLPWWYEFESRLHRKHPRVGQDIEIFTQGNGAFTHGPLLDCGNYAAADRVGCMSVAEAWAQR